MAEHPVASSLSLPLKMLSYQRINPSDAYGDAHLLAVLKVTILYSRAVS